MLIMLMFKQFKKVFIVMYHDEYIHYVDNVKFKQFKKAFIVMYHDEYIHYVDNVNVQAIQESVHCYVSR